MGLGVEKHQELAEQSVRNIRNSNPELLTSSPPRIQIMAGNVLSGGFDIDVFVEVVA